MTDTKRAFWRSWLPGSVIGWLLGSAAIVATLGSILLEAGITTEASVSLQQNVLVNMALMAGASGFGGMLVGLGQGTYLRPRLEQPLMWPLYSALGWLGGGALVGLLLSISANNQLPGILFTVLGMGILVVPGAVAGVLQRNLIGIPAWLTASMFSVSLGWVATALLVVLLPGLVGVLIACLTGGLVAAYLAGDALWRMVLDPPRKKQSSKRKK